MFETKQKESGLVLDIIAGTDGRELVWTAMDEDMLARAVRRQSRAMVQSVSREIAHAGWQARLDACRAKQALRIAQELQGPAIEAIAQIADQGQRMAEIYPEVAAVIAEMTRDDINMVSQIPGVTVRANMARHFDTRANRCRRRGDC